MPESHPNESVALKVGDAAPDFTLRNTDGGDVRLSAGLAERPLALVFYRGDWCAWCQNQLIQLAGLYERIQTHGADLWAISPQSENVNQSLRERRGLPFPILADRDQAVMRAWGVFKEVDPEGRAIPYPATYVVNRDGRIHWRHLGLGMRDRPQAVEVVAAVTALTNGNP